MIASVRCPQVFTALDLAYFEALQISSDHMEFDETLDSHSTTLTQQHLTGLNLLSIRV